MSAIIQCPALKPTAIIQSPAYIQKCMIFTRPLSEIGNLTLEILDFNIGFRTIHVSYVSVYQYDDKYADQAAIEFHPRRPFVW